MRLDLHHLSGSFRDSLDGFGVRLHHLLFIGGLRLAGRKGWSPALLLLLLGCLLWRLWGGEHNRYAVSDCLCARSLKGKPASFSLIIFTGVRDVGVFEAWAS